MGAPCGGQAGAPLFAGRALWRGGADAWRREQAERPLMPQALGSHALRVAMHPEGAEVVFGTDRLLLAGD